MSHKRTKKDVEDAYRRGFEAGFTVRPNPVAMILRAIWRKHELKKHKKAWQEMVKSNGGVHPVWSHIRSEPLGFIKNIREDENGLSADITLGQKDA